MLELKLTYVSKRGQWCWACSPSNSHVSQRFSPSGEQPEHRILAHELEQPTAGCVAISNIAALQNVGILKQIWLDKIPQRGYMEHGLNLRFMLKNI